MDMNAIEINSENLFAVIKEESSYVMTNVMSMPTFDISWFGNGTITYPTHEISYRDARFTTKFGYVKFIGVKEDAESQLAFYNAINDPPEPIDLQAQVDQLKKELTEMRVLVEELLIFKRNYEHLVNKVVLADSNEYKAIGKNNIKVYHNDLAVAIGKKDLDGFIYLIAKIFTVNPKGNKWSNFSERQLDDFKDLMGHYISAKQDHENLLRPSTNMNETNEPSTSSPPKILTLHQRVEKLKVAFQRKMQGKDKNDRDIETKPITKPNNKKLKN